MEKVKQYMYYIVIGIVSLIALLFLPMIGSELGLAWNIPNTIVGWVVWVATKLIVAVINVLIFHSFMCQAKLNVKNDEKYREANEILGRVKVKKYVPRSPHQYNGQQYGKKGTIIFVTSALSTIALTQAILTFDWMAMLTYLFTIIMGLIFGVLQMKTAEEYWTDEYYRYALLVKEENERKIQEAVEMAEKERAEQRDDTVGTDSGSDILVTGDSNISTSSDSKPMVVDSCDSYNSILGRTIHTCSSTTNSTSLSIEKAISTSEET